MYLLVGKVTSTKVNIVTRRKATILADYKFFTSARIDDCYQFIDCAGANGGQVAKDVRAGVLKIDHRQVIIALGNDAVLNQFTNIASVVMPIATALIERQGCLRTSIWIMSLLPRPLARQEEEQCLKEQNKKLFRSVRALVRRKQYPVTFLTAHKWLLKRVKTPGDDRVRVEIDHMFFEENSNQLNEQGLWHLHLLMAKELGLRKIKYAWSGMPVVVQQDGPRMVTRDPKSQGAEKRGKTLRDRRRRSARAREYGKNSESSEEPPVLVPIQME